MSRWDLVLERFRTYQEASGLRARTIEGREATLRALSKHSNRMPEELEFDDLTRFLTRPHAYTGERLSPGTKQVERSYLQIWSQWATEEGEIPVDIARRLPRVRVPRRRARPIAQAHIDAMLKLDTLWQTTLDLIAVAANTGLRVAEIVRIHGTHYDSRTAVLKVVRKGGLVQYIYCNKAVIEIAERLPSDGWWFPSPYKNHLFPDGDGHILPKSASARMTAVLRRIGVEDPRVTGHSLRHFYCCLQIRLGIPIHIVQELMGHASLNTTQNYIKVTEEELEAAVAGMPYIPATLSSMNPGTFPFERASRVPHASHEQLRAAS